MEACVVTDIKNGIGNILSEILVGLFFAKQLSFITDEKYNYYGLLTDKCFNGHEMIYNKHHYDNLLPHPLNLSAIFPKINFIVRAPNNMVNLHYLAPIPVERLKMVKRLNLRVDSITQILMELKNNRDILDKISFSDNITQYTLTKYAPTSKSLAIHVRIRQSGDYMYVRLPDLQWYKNTVDEYIRSHGTPDKIFLITGISTAEIKHSQFKDEILDYLKSKCETVIDVIDEPYYVDMSILSISGTKIITNSSFSLFASFIDFTDEKIVIYPECLTQEFRLGDHVILPNFIKSP